MQGISASGKTYLSRLLGEALYELTTLEKDDVTVLELDNFYRPIEDVFEIQGLDQNEGVEALKKVNWDDPNLIDYDKLIKSLEELMETGETTVNEYVKTTGTYSSVEITYKAKKVVIVESFLLFSSGIPMEGKYMFSDKLKESVLKDQEKTSQRIEELIDVKIGVTCNETEAFGRRLARDSKQTGRKIETTAIYWKRDTIPAAREYIYPLLNAAENNIFDAFINNTVLRPLDIDKSFKLIVSAIPEVHNIGYSPKFIRSEDRFNWYTDKYENIRIKDAEQTVQGFYRLGAPADY